jgi:hypothetical protein
MSAPAWHRLASPYHWRVALEIVDFYRATAPALAGTHGLRYPRELEARLLERFQALG